MAGLKCRFAALVAALLILPATPAAAAATRTELAGNPLTQYPFFEYVRAFNANAPVNVVIDPTRFPAISGDTCNIFVVNSKTPSQWTADPSLADVTAGGSLTHTFSGGTIQANIVQVAAASELNANAGTGLGVAYDVVLDCDQNGQLSDGDFIDGLNGEAGFYVVSDTTAPGPLAVIEQVYNLDSTVASSFGIPPLKLGEDLYFPTNIAAMGRLPIVIISRGNGHMFTWYDHIGFHLASYGYVVMSHDNNTEPGTMEASETTLRHTDAFIDQAEAGAIAGGALVGHLDANRITWIGHSRGAEGVAIAYDKLFDTTFTPTHYSKSSIRLISSMLPVTFQPPDVGNPHDANYHLWTASGDRDVDGWAGDDGVQTFHLHDRATGYRQSTIVQGAGHGWFHDEDSVDPWVTGPCQLNETITHQIQLGYLLPLIKHYVEGNVPALDFLTRQYESFHPISVPTTNPCVVVTNEYRNGSPAGNLIIDDYQTQPATNISSIGGAVTFDVDNLTEDRLDDNNSDFTWTSGDPFNGATQAGPMDSSRGVVFDWTNQDKFYEWQIPAGNRNFSGFRFLSLRGAQGTQHPNTLAQSGDLTFSVTLRDGAGTSSRINIGAFGGGLEKPYARGGGWHNEMESVHMRTADFANNGSGLNLNDIAAVRLSFGPSFGSASGRIVVDQLMLSNEVSPLSLQIIEPTTLRPAYAGTAEWGSRVLVRVTGNGLDLSPSNITVSVAGVALTPPQIPTAAAQVGGETWIVIAPGARPDGCYDLTVALTSPAGTSAAQPQSLCYSNDEARILDRVVAIDQTNSMNYDGTTNTPSTAKMEAARAAGAFFVDLANPQDQIGVVAFQRRDQDGNGSITDPDELAEVRFPLTLAGENVTDQRPAARAAVASIDPDTSPGFTGPETSPGAALTESRAMLDAGGGAGHEPHIFLLTDGLENYAPFWSRSGPSGSPLRPQFEADDIRVDTVGIGMDADDLLLEDIAAATGGEFRNLNEGSGSFFLLSRLADWYKRVDEDVRGEQRFHYLEGLPPGQIPVSDMTLRYGQFQAEPALDWMTFAHHSNLDDAMTVWLYAPGSSSPVSASTPGVRFFGDAKHSVYRIAHPAAGTWYYVVRPLKPSAELFFVASGPTLLAARVGPKQLARRPAGDFLMPLRVWVADTTAVRGASVTGYVRRPDGVKDPVTLVDNGMSMDGAANDAIYGLPYVATIPGAYYVSLDVDGTSNAGVPFQRYLATAFVVAGQPKRPVQPGEGLPVPPRGPKRCGCDSEAKVTLAAFGGITIPHGSFDTVADTSTSFGLKAAKVFNTPTAIWSAGLYLGRDNFKNSLGGSDFHLTHLSGEIELAPWRRLCPRPAFHAGIGLYRNESSDTAAGFNLGTSLSFCLTQKASLVWRYDFRHVGEFNRDYSTLQLGLRIHFP